MKDYKSFRWFYTSSGKLVVGGKNAKQNDELLKNIKKNYYILHTSQPGSPFCVIVAESEKVTEKDILEVAIFTGCFSKAWKSGMRKTSVDIFKMNQLSKDKDMKVGTWRVSGKIRRISVELKLVLTKQKGVYRAVPEQSAKKALLRILPGKVDKKEMIPKFQLELDNEFHQDEILSALPAGGIRIGK